MTPEPTSPTATVARKPWAKRVMHVIRRGHLYFGLFLFPWACLYGVTAFLFNHPTAFSDQPTTSFRAGDLANTPLADPPQPQAIADALVGKLNERFKPAVPFTAAQDARFQREFAFATVKADGQSISILVDARTGAGTIRSAPEKPKPTVPKAPFAIGAPAAPTPTQRIGERSAPATGDRLLLANGLADRMRRTLPSILERFGYPHGEVQVTSVPDVVFTIHAEGRSWRATYNPLSGTVSGVPTEQVEPTELSVRRFLLRLHLAHGYPGEQNAKWFWAIIVDAMAFVMIFWALSGLLMWRQLKGTRRAGGVVLLLSTVGAVALGVAMHDLFTTG